jgi:hypothetical protein
MKKLVKTVKSRCKQNFHFLDFSYLVTIHKNNVVRTLKLLLYIKDISFSYLIAFSKQVKQKIHVSLKISHFLKV